MKKSLPAAMCFYALSLFSAHQTIAQIKGHPVLKAPALEQMKLVKTSLNISHDLQDLSATNRLTDPLSRSQSKPSRINNASQRFMITKDDRVLVNMTLKAGSKAPRTALEKLGMEITATYGRMVSGFISADDIPKLATIAGIRYVRPVYKMKSQLKTIANHQAPARLRNAVEPVISQGDSAQRSDVARRQYKVTGKGVKIGILSDSYNNNNIANIGVEQGEIPGKVGPFGSEDAVEVLQDLIGVGTDEGRAIAEILHDVAPDAELAFHTAFNGQANFAQGIINLADVGCKIILDDALYPDEPFFQDGIIAQAVNEVNKRGVTYFAAAGNKGNLSYESEYRPSQFSPFITSSIYGTAHNFNAPGDPPNYFQPISIPANSLFSISFQWSQPFFSAGGLGADTDMDIFLLDANGVIVATSIDDNITSGDPVELMNYYNATESNIFYVTILKFNGPDPGKLKYVSFGDDISFFVPTPAIPGVYAPALIGHPNAAGAIAVAAANYNTTPAFGVNPPQVEFFSSEGGVAHLFDDQGYPVTPVVRKKPEITAPDGGNTSFFFTDSRQDIDEFPNFFGTSAAIAHAAGVAALMMEAQKLNTITPDQIKGVLASKAIDMDNANTIGFDVGFDYKTGAGLIQADAAVNVVRFPKVYVRNLRVKSACSVNPSATREWTINNPNAFEVKAHWFLIGFPQYGTVQLQPGVTAVTTTTGYLYNKEVPNIVLMTWEDNFGFPRFSIAVSNKEDCNNPSSANTEQGQQRAAESSEPIVHPDIAEAYPNPVGRSYKLYLSLPGRQRVDVELYGVDGKQLSRRTVPAEGVVTMDASTYKPGVYYVKITGLNFSKTIQLIKL